MSSTPRHPELEEAIVRDPESADAYLVYGDWLLEQGDDLGELVSVQAALEKSSDRADLKEREQALLAANAKRWIGHFARYNHAWRFGFLNRIVVPEPTRVDCEELLALVAARFLRDLELEVLGHRIAENCELISALADVGLPPALRRLALVTSGDPRAVDVGSVRALWPRLARVEEVVIHAGNIGLGAIDLPRVETFTLTTSATRETLNALAAARWPRLSSFSLSIPSSGYPPSEVDATLFPPLIDALGQHGGVRHFELALRSAGTSVLPELVGSPLLASLTSLALPRCAITDDDCKVLLERAAAFEHLASLRLEHNRLGPQTCEALQKIFGERVQVTPQDEPDAYADYGEYYDDVDE